jgi:hypothetical protein
MFYLRPPQGDIDTMPARATASMSPRTLHAMSPRTLGTRGGDREEASETLRQGRF